MKNDGDEDDPFSKKKKKKKLPFYGRVGGRISRRRADRKAGGGAVKKLAVGGGADCPPGGSSMPGAGPGAGGGYFPASAPGGATGNAIAGALMGPGGGLANFRPMKKGGGVKKRAEGGPTGEEERSAGLKKLSGAMKAETSKSPGEARPFDNPRTSASNVSRYVRPGLAEERGGFKKGGGVRKLVDGGGAAVGDSTLTVEAPPVAAPPISDAPGPLMAGSGLGGGAGIGAASGAAPNTPLAQSVSETPSSLTTVATTPDESQKKKTSDLKRGGAVKKRAEGGEVSDEDRKKGIDKLKTRMTDPESGPKLQRLQRERMPLIQDLARPRDWGGGTEKYKDGGKLSASQRQSLPKSDFALPGAGEGPKGAGSGSYPIPDKSHARNALARSSGKPVAAQVRAKVKAKYPDIG